MALYGETWLWRRIKTSSLAGTQQEWLSTERPVPHRDPAFGKAAGTQQEWLSTERPHSRKLHGSLWAAGTQQEWLSTERRSGILVERHRSRLALNKNGSLRRDKRAHVQLELPQPSGSGYVLDSLSFAARAAASGGTYEDVVLIAIRLGADTDTTAAIAGGIVALRDGMDAIPQRWLDLIRGKELANGIIDSFLTSRELRSQTHVTCPSCDGLGCLMCDNTGQIPRPRLLPGETF